MDDLRDCTFASDSGSKTDLYSFDKLWYHIGLFLISSISLKEKLYIALLYNVVLWVISHKLTDFSWKNMSKKVVH